MIGFLRGRLISKTPQFILMDVGGVGYRVFVSLNTFYRLENENAEQSLFIHTVVRDDAIHLFGFANRREQEVFERLISVSGIGPKVAISILSRINVDDLVTAVTGGDHLKLTAVPGVGRKTAERLILELKDRFLEVIGMPSDLPAAAQEEIQEILDALVNLGYNKIQAQKALQTARRDLGTDASLEQILKAAIKIAAAK